MTQNNIVIHTDGACRGNPGPGGWGAILECDGNSKEIYGAQPDATNNQMELMAAIAALETLKRPCKVILITDSVYVKNGITIWISGWKRNNWRTANKKPVKNQELWRRLDLAVLEHQVTWQWVKGHSGNVGNERADSLANIAIDELLCDK